MTEKTFNFFGVPVTQEQFYHSIMELYDNVDEILNAIDDPNVVNADDQIALTKPYLEKVQENIECLASQYIEYAENGSVPSPKLASEIERAVRAITHATVDFADNATKRLVHGSS